MALSGFITNKVHMTFFFFDFNMSNSILAGNLDWPLSYVVIHNSWSTFLPTLHLTARFECKASAYLDWDFWEQIVQQHFRGRFRNVLKGLKGFLVFSWAAGPYSQAAGILYMIKLKHCERTFGVDFFSWSNFTYKCYKWPFRIVIVGFQGFLYH